MKVLLKNGEKEFNEFSEIDKERYLTIKEKWFSKWETAYQGVHYVWNLFLEDETFKISIMMYVLPPSFSSFMKIGLKSIITKTTDMKEEEDF